MQTVETVGKLTAHPRTVTGKGEARKLRARGLVPAILYGQGKAPEMLSLDPKELHQSLDPEKQHNTLIELKIGDGASSTQKVMLKDHQADVVARTLTHVDLIRVSTDVAVEAWVPLVLEGRPEGVKLGGVLNQVFRTLRVTCTPDKIPASLTADVTSLQLNDVLHISDLTPPEGVEIAMAKTQTVALVLTPKRVVEETPAAEGGEDGAAAAEGADAAAAPAKKEG